MPRKSARGGEGRRGLPADAAGHPAQKAGAVLGLRRLGVTLVPGFPSRLVIAGAGRLAGLFPLGQQALELGAVHGIPGVRAVGHSPLEPGRQARGRKEISGGAHGRIQRLGQRWNLRRGGEGCGGFCVAASFFTVRKNLRQQVGTLGL